MVPRVPRVMCNSPLSAVPEWCVCFLRCPCLSAIPMIRISGLLSTREFSRQLSGACLPSDLYAPSSISPWPLHDYEHAYPRDIRSLKPRLGFSACCYSSISSISTSISLKYLQSVTFLTSIVRFSKAPIIVGRSSIANVLHILIL